MNKSNCCGCGCNKCSCSCPCSCDKNEMYMALGKWFYSIITEVPLPPCHPNWDEIICSFMNGQSLPPCHPGQAELKKYLCSYFCCNCK